MVTVINMTAFTDSGVLDLYHHIALLGLVEDSGFGAYIHVLS